MATNFRSWFPSWGVATSNTSSSGENDLIYPLPSITLSVSPPLVENEEGDDDEATETETDRPPAFPALNSIQRSGGDRGSSSPSLRVVDVDASEDSLRMPPPSFIPSTSRAKDDGIVAIGGNSSFGGLALPPSTTKPLPNVNKKAQVRGKVALAPGHSPLDWARLKSSGTDLRVRRVVSMTIV